MSLTVNSWGATFATRSHSSSSTYWAALSWGNALLRLAYSWFCDALERLHFSGVPRLLQPQGCGLRLLSAPIARWSTCQDSAPGAGILALLSGACLWWLPHQVSSRLPSSSAHFIWLWLVSADTCTRSQLLRSASLDNQPSVQCIRIVKGKNQHNTDQQNTTKNYNNHIFPLTHLHEHPIRGVNWSNTFKCAINHLRAK